MAHPPTRWSVVDSQQAVGVEYARETGGEGGFPPGRLVLIVPDEPDGRIELRFVPRTGWVTPFPFSPDTTSLPAVLRPFVEKLLPEARTADQVEVATRTLLGWLADLEQHLPHEDGAAAQRLSTDILADVLRRAAVDSSVRSVLTPEWSRTVHQLDDTVDANDQLAQFWPLTASLDRLGQLLAGLHDKSIDHLRMALPRAFGSAGFDGKCVNDTTAVHQMLEACIRHLYGGAGGEIGHGSGGDGPHPMLFGVPSRAITTGGQPANPGNLRDLIDPNLLPEFYDAIRAHPADLYAKPFYGQLRQSLADTGANGRLDVVAGEGCGQIEPTRSFRSVTTITAHSVELLTSFAVRTPHALVRPVKAVVAEGLFREDNPIPCRLPALWFGQEFRPLLVAVPIRVAAWPCHYSPARGLIAERCLAVNVVHDTVVTAFRRYGSRAGWGVMDILVAALTA